LQGQVRFNRVPEKVPEKVWEALVQPGQVQQGFGEGSRRRSGGFSAEPGQFQQGPGEGLGGFGAARSGSTGWRRSGRL